MNEKKFLLGIIHEVKNSAGILQGLMELLKRNLNRQEQKLTGEMSAEITHLSHILKRSAPLVNSPEFSIFTVQVAELLDRVIFLAQEDLLKKRITLEKRYKKDLPEIKGDPELLQEAFLNLLSNGIEAMPKGGKFIIQAMPRDNFLQIEFIDSGAGIPRENLNKIFTPFFTTRKEGLGLGLPLVQKIIKKHRGEIKVKSEEGKGSKFIVSLPLKPRHCDPE